MDLNERPHTEAAAQESTGKHLQSVAQPAEDYSLINTRVTRPRTCPLVQVQERSC